MKLAGGQNHFYVTLLSNGSQKSFPTNTLSAFTTRMSQTIDLGSTDRREVGVCEFTCHLPIKGMVYSLQIVSADTALIYCGLISEHFMGVQYYDA